MLRFLYLCVVAVVSQFFASAWGAAGDADLRERIRLLEKKQDEMFRQFSSEKGKVKAFLGDELSLGGFFDTAITGIWGTGTNTQFSATPNTLALNLAAELERGFRLNSQALFNFGFPLVNPNNDPRGPSVGLPDSRLFNTFTITPSVSQAYLEYNPGPEFSVQMGRGYVPFGIAFALRDQVLFRRRGGPMMLSANTSGSIAIASGLWTGLHLSGSFRMEKGKCGYNAYTITPFSNPRSMGGGARVWLEGPSVWTFGLSSQTANQGGFTYQALGADLKLKADRFGTDAEFATNVRTDSAGNSKSFYLEPYYIFANEKFLVYTAVDYLDNPVGQTAGPSSSHPDPIKKWAFGGGINWLPSRFTRIRTGFLFYDYTGSTAHPDGESRDYYSLDFSAGVEF